MITRLRPKRRLKEKIILDSNTEPKIILDQKSKPTSLPEIQFATVEFNYADEPAIEFLSPPNKSDSSNTKFKSIIDTLLGISKVEKEKEKVKETKKIFQPSLDKPIDIIDTKINSLDDLIKLGELYEKDNYQEKNYSVNIKGIFDMKEALIDLNNMIGLDKIKKNIVNQIMYYSQTLHNEESDMMHTIIKGPPGVGKTQLGEILSKVYLALGVSSNSKFIKVKRADLVGEYLGHTAMKTQKMIDKARGGVLFIDEAYSLGSEKGNDSYSKECLDTINQNLSERKGEFICIIAGYEESLDKCFFASNPGLRRRFNFEYTIDEYSSDELIDILNKQITDYKWSIDEEVIQKIKSNKLIDKHQTSFKYFGGDIERWFTNIKIEHSKRVFGKDIDLQKKLIWDDIENGLTRFIENSNSKKEDIKYLAMYM